MRHGRTRRSRMTSKRFDTSARERGSTMDRTRIVNKEEYVKTGSGYNPYNTRPWAIGNEYGLLCVVYANHEQDAFDYAADAGMLDGLSIDAETVNEREEEYDGEGVMYCGNADEPFDSIHAWITKLPNVSPLRIAMQDESDLYDGKIVK
jgi:hypothetical protein